MYIIVYFLHLFILEAYRQDLNNLKTTNKQQTKQHKQIDSIVHLQTQLVSNPSKSSTVPMKSRKKTGGGGGPFQISRFWECRSQIQLNFFFLIRSPKRVIKNLSMDNFLSHKIGNSVLNKDRHSPECSRRRKSAYHKSDTARQMIYNINLCRQKS